MLKRLDHLICEVPDIRTAMRWFVFERGYPEAWPVGPFWPNALTSGVALGGINLEFLQSLERPVEEPVIRTLVFEPSDLEESIAYYASFGFPMTLRDKWEPNPELLLLRGFTPEESATPQRICRNLVPDEKPTVDFFLCEYVPFLKQRLGPSAFPGLTPVRKVIVEIPSTSSFEPNLIPLDPAAPIQLEFRPASVEFAQVAEIRTDEGLIPF